MEKNNIILIIGQNKNNDFFKKSIDTYVSRNDITEIVLVTYINENIDYIRQNNNIKKILVPKKKFELSCGYQKYLYDIGIKYIANNFNIENTFILKTRMILFFHKNIK